MPIKEDLKSLDSMIKTMDDQLKTLSDTVDMNITSVYGLNIGIKNEINKFTIDQIKNLSNVQIDSILKNGFDGKGENTNRESLTNLYSNNDDYKDKEFSDYAKDTFVDIKIGLDEVTEIEKQRNKIKADVDDAVNNYFSYINSAEYKAKKKAKIEDMRAKAENENDEVAKRRINEMLDAMDAAESFDFLLTRIKERGDAEIDDIVYAFFNPNKSEVIMNKYASAIKGYGYNKDIYKMFFNLEEKFLDDEYNKYNNLFLFIVMRYIAYSNPYSKSDPLCINAILSKIYNLIYHKYEAVDQEKATIAFIAQMDDYFKDYADKFIECNTTSPDHPVRIQRDNEYEVKRRAMLISSLQNEGIDVDTNMETSELKKMLEEVMERKQNEIPQEQINELNDTNDSFDGMMNPPITDMNDDINTESEIAQTIIDIASSEESKDLDNMEDEVYNELHSESVSTEDVEVEPEVSICENEPVWMDVYKCTYVKMTDGTYTYNDENNECIEKNVSEDTVLKLISAGAIRKDLSIN